MVECADSGYENDCYLHRNTADLKGMKVGDMVAFEIHESSRGKPQVSAPMWVQVGCTDPDAPLEFGEFLGQVTKVSQTGLGELECPTVMKLHGQAAKIHRGVLQQCALVEGDVVAFSINIDNKTGEPWMSAPCWKCASSETWIEAWSEGRQAAQPDIDVDRGIAEAPSQAKVEGSRCSEGERPAKRSKMGRLAAPVLAAPV